MVWQTNPEGPEPRGIRSPIDIGFLIGAVALVLVGWVSHRTTQRLNDENGWVEHSYVVLGILDRMQLDLSMPPTDSSRVRVAADLAQLQSLTNDNVLQQQRLDSLRSVLKTGHTEGTAVIVRMLESEEQRLLSTRRSSVYSTGSRSTTIILFSTVLGVVLMAIALALLHDDLRRRRAAEMALGESEAKYRVLMEQAADAILIVDSEAVCVEGNVRAGEILGRPVSEIPGLPLKAFVRGNGPSTGPVLPMLRYGRVTTGEFWVSRPDGSRVAVEIRATMLEDGRVQVIARDISERKEVERVKDEFVSVVSHELRTPLTSIRGALGLLAAGKLDDAPQKRQRMLDLATSNTDRLIRLINDILDIERMNAGAIAFERADILTSTVVNQVVEAIRPIAERNNVSIKADVAELHISADGDRMAQTLTNLVDNAVKFSPNGSSVDVSVRREGRFALFEVRDHGRGIPSEMKNAIFNRFQQVDTSDSREKGGTGLGLAICRSIVEQHGGRIWVESEPGEGSAFKYTIPLVYEERATPGMKGMTQVLVCDDDDDLVEVLRTILTARGYHVTGARRGREAMEQIDAFHPEVAVIDIQLPDINGLRVLRHVHSASPTTKILVYTATYLEGAEKDFIRSIGAIIVTKGRTAPDRLADEVERLVSPRATPATSLDPQPG